MKRFNGLLCAALALAFIPAFLICCKRSNKPEEAQIEQSEQQVSAAVAADGFDWRAHSGASLVIMFNQHPYADAVIAKIIEFQRATGIRINFTGREFMLFSGTEGSCVDTPRRSVAESPEYISIVGASTGYLEALAADTPNATIYFTPQPYFFETTTEWAAALQDIVSGHYSSTGEGMRQLTQRLNRIVGDIRIDR